MTTSLFSNGTCKECGANGSEWQEVFCEKCTQSFAKGEILRFAQGLQELLGRTWAGNLEDRFYDLGDEARKNEDEIAEIRLKKIETIVSFWLHLSSETIEKIGDLFGVAVELEWMRECREKKFQK